MAVVELKIGSASLFRLGKPDIRSSHPFHTPYERGQRARMIDKLEEVVKRVNENPITPFTYGEPGISDDPAYKARQLAVIEERHQQELLRRPKPQPVPFTQRVKDIFTLDTKSINAIPDPKRDQYIQELDELHEKYAPTSPKKRLEMDHAALSQRAIDAQRKAAGKIFSAEIDTKREAHIKHIGSNTKGVTAEGAAAMLKSTPDTFYARQIIEVGHRTLEELGLASRINKSK